MVPTAPNSLQSPRMVIIHKDHIKGVETFIKKSNLKLFIPKKMFKSLKENIPNLKEEDCIYIDEDEEFAKTILDKVKEYWT